MKGGAWLTVRQAHPACGQCDELAHEAEQIGERIKSYRVSVQCGGHAATVDYSLRLEVQQ